MCEALFCQTHLNFWQLYMSLSVYIVYVIIFLHHTDTVLGTSSSAGSAGSFREHQYCLNKHFNYYIGNFSLKQGNISYCQGISQEDLSSKNENHSLLPSAFRRLRKGRNEIHTELNSNTGNRITSFDAAVYIVVIYIVYILRYKYVLMLQYIFQHFSFIICICCPMGSLPIHNTPGRHK